jgi:hypothetical protein
MKRTQRSPHYGTRISEVVTDAVIMNRDDWRRIKKEAVHLTAAQQMALYHDEDARKKQTMREIKNQRAGLLEAEREKQVQKKVRATQREMEERELALAIAEAKGNEDIDEVKAMNTAMIQARVLTLRDRQMEFQRAEADLAKQFEDEEAQMLEEGRQRALKIYADREAALAEQRKKGGRMIVAQMEEKKRTAKLEAEQREREIEEMRIANEMAREEELRIEEDRRLRSREFVQDCMAANAIALRRKQRDKEREIEEGLMMVEYQKEKAAREEEFERQVQEQKAAKEREISEMRKRQQRTIDLKAQEDALRARRIEEEKERIARKKELDDLRKRFELKEIQDKDRQETFAIKQRRLVEMAKIEKAEFDRVSAAQAKAREKERQAALKRDQDNAEYRQHLKDEMHRKKIERQMQPLVNLDDQRHMEELKEDYILKLERIRQMKLETLRAEGVPEKYLVDLLKMRFDPK